jgi:uncharacterized SAM-binding protein YcdF (DUF218 family)
VLDAARRALAYLSETDPTPPHPVDAVVGFGTFDLALPIFCAEVFFHTRARKIIFTGGIGAGTADLGEPEADAWAKVALAARRELRSEHLILENRSTNTAENIHFTAALLAREYPDFQFGAGLNHAIIVASPSRLRRAKLTLQHLQPTLRITRALPAVDFDREFAEHERKGIPYLAHLSGELDRMVSYPARGWIAEEKLPGEIAEAHAMLRAEQR